MLDFIVGFVVCGVFLDNAGRDFVFFATAIDPENKTVFHLVACMVACVYADVISAFGNRSFEIEFDNIAVATFPFSHSESFVKDTVDPKLDCFGIYTGDIVLIFAVVADNIS